MEKIGYFHNHRERDFLSKFSKIISTIKLKKVLAFMYCISLLFRDNYAYMYQFKLYGNIDYLTGFTIRARDGGKNMYFTN